MFQLTYTSCKPGMSLDGSTGYTVRAASAGIEPVWLRVAPQLARFDTSVLSRTSESVRMMFHRKDGVSIAVRTQRTLDHDSRVASFTHAVIDPAGRLGPREAISAWESQFWKRNNDDQSVVLPGVDSLIAGETLNWTSLQQRLERPDFQLLARFVMSAWFSNPAGVVVFSTDAEAMAAAIWLLTYSVPPTMLADFSFATLDHDPAKAGVALAGSCAAPNANTKSTLGKRSWLNARTGECREVASGSYAGFVVSQTAAGNWKSIQAFLDHCEQLDVSDARDLDLLHRVSHESHVCTETELTQVQSRSKLLRWLLQDDRHARVAASLVGLATTDPKVGADITAALRENPARIDMLFASFLKRAAEEIRTGNVDAATHWIDLCVSNDRRCEASTLWRTVVERSNCAIMPVATRARIAAKLQAGACTQDSGGLVDQLLTFSGDELAELLRTPINGEMKAQACQLAISRQECLPSFVVELLSRQPQVMSRLLGIASDPVAIASQIAASNPSAVIELLCTDESLRGKVDLNAVLDHLSTKRSVLFESLLTPAVLRYWPVVLKSRSAIQIVDAVMNLSLDKLPGDINQLLRTAIKSLRLSQESVARVERRISLNDALANKDTPIPHIETMAAAIADLQGSDRRRAAMQVLPRLVARAIASPAPDVARQLDVLLNLAVTHAAHPPAPVLRGFAARACKSGRLLRDPKLALITLAHAFGAAGTWPKDDVSRDQLLALGVELLALYLRAGGPVLIRHLGEQADRWPEPSRSFFRLAAQRQRVNGRVMAFFARRRAVVSER